MNSKENKKKCCMRPSIPVLLDAVLTACHREADAEDYHSQLVDLLTSLTTGRDVLPESPKTFVAKLLHHRRLLASLCSSSYRLRFDGSARLLIHRLALCFGVWSLRSPFPGCPDCDYLLQGKASTSGAHDLLRVLEVTVDE